MSDESRTFASAGTVSAAPDLASGTEEVRVLRIQPGDVLVATIPNQPTSELADDLAAEVVGHLKRLWPDNEHIVLCDGIELSVGRKADV